MESGFFKAQKRRNGFKKDTREVDSKKTQGASHKGNAQRKRFGKKKELGGTVKEGRYKKREGG